MIIHRVFPRPHSLRWEYSAFRESRRETHCPAALSVDRPQLSFATPSPDGRGASLKFSRKERKTILSLLLLIFEIFTIEFWEAALSPEKVLEYSTALIKVLIVLVLAWIATVIVNRVVPRIRERMVAQMVRGREPDAELEKRARTISKLFRRTFSALIWVVAAITALQQTGFDIGPILATAGVAGLAVSFGAQNLVRDIFAGVFILLENQIRVGDVAQVNGTGGLVEEINLRTVRLRGLDGTVYIFPNGTITTLANMTNEFSFYLWDLGVAYKEDPRAVMKVMKFSSTKSFLLIMMEK